MAESQRKNAPATSLDEDPAQKMHERSFIVLFAVGLITLVAAMIFIATGLSNNFDLTSVSFIAFATLAVLTGVAWVWHWSTGRKL